MATTTPNYGWTVPTSTDLVKDGATAIETLGDAIDASMNTALGTKKAGMVLLNTTSFSGVSSVSLPANTFSATYENYKVIVNFSASAGLTPQLRLRAAGTDNTGATSYRYSGFRVTASNTTAISPYSTGDSKWALGAVIASNFNDYLTIELKSPFATEYTKFMAEQQADENFGSRYMHGGTFTATTSFDSLSFIASANNITGTIYAYGYNK
jgi:hypothetical protein